LEHRPGSFERSLPGKPAKNLGNTLSPPQNWRQFISSRHNKQITYQKFLLSSGSETHFNTNKFARIEPEKVSSYAL
jgi:hypothetical protein